MSACIAVTDEVFSEPRTVNRSLELGDVELVDAEVNMPAGDLRITGGSPKLMDGEFIFTSPVTEPQLSYKDTGVRGRLRISGAKRKIGTHISDDNRWAVRLNDDVPLDLTVSLGAGECDLELAGMTLRSVDVKMGAGECNLDLVGEWGRNFSVDVRGGVGEFTVRVPDNVGVIAKAKGAIGEVDTKGFRKEGGRYVNGAYGDSPVTITLDIRGGIGEINLVEVD